jgi:hypothetical protein
MKLRTIAYVLSIAACTATSSEPPLHASSSTVPDPVVDMACVQRAQDGKLSMDLPAQLGPFHVTSRADGAHLHRDGRAITDDEGKKLWNAFNHDAFGPGMSQADYGLYSTQTCDDADKNSCVKLKVWACQVSLDVLGGKIATALDHAGLSDAALSVDVAFLEPRGPKCNRGDNCMPVQHYSTHGEYLPGAEHVRSSTELGHGACKNDGDCEPGGQACMAWYLLGGISTTEFIQYDQPTFCGCMHSRCRWFHQD